MTAEQGRVDAENARVAAEQAREDAETGYVAQAQAAAAQAQQYASSDYVKTAQSWAIGGTSSRYGEDTNNAKYWAEIAAEVVTDGGVASFNGRTGQVSPETGDYDTTMIARGTGSAESALAAIESGIGTTTLPTKAQTLTGAIAEHENDITALNSKWVVEKKTISVPNVAAGATEWVTSSIAKSGYTAVGVVGWYFAGETGNSFLFPYSMMVANNNSSVAVRNLSTTASSGVSMLIDVLYQKT